MVNIKTLMSHKKTWIGFNSEVTIGQTTLFRFKPVQCQKFPIFFGRIFHFKNFRLFPKIDGNLIFV